MSILKCKMCGGDLEVTEEIKIVECDYCGTKQTVPSADNEKKVNLFNRANRLRMASEFDKAAGIYENIIAEFPEEAEAYWGLCLCNYGIEYVDDPATAKKIPTCHRASFESLQKDENFELALEYADVIAQKLYRDEAREIDRIMGEILAVSKNEKPYDVFICYKETDDKGGRTVDSVLAYDIYEALTAKGFNVFFSRVTLEDKLGMQYEPYIFAALNSAKVMLSIGTKYEYFQAVWVKNEWSRFLKLMAKDKSKVLIPCFKDIDAYDMPDEFKGLQAQDLGKLGAVQDIVRGVEKLIPRQAVQSSVVHEQVVVGGSGDNKIPALLDRGNMALEDGDWAKADSFFEDVLNNDSKNAQAYLGKTLAQERCRTIDAFVRKRKDASQKVYGQKLALQADLAHIDEIVKKFSLPGFVDPNEIRRLYVFDLSYHSDVAERKQQYNDEEKYWADHKQLSRAEKFAAGSVAENLQQEKKALFDVLSDRVKKAEEAERNIKKDIKTGYEAHLRKSDEQAEKLYNDGVARREQHYNYLLQIAKASSNVGELTETANKFFALGDYQDSKNLAEYCRKRAEEEQAKLYAEAERQRLIKESQEKKKKAKIKKITISVTAAVVAMIVFIVLLNTMIIPGGKYNDAVALLDAKQYEEAMQILDTIPTFKDSEQLYEDAFCAVKATYKEQADKYLAEGDLLNSAIFYGKAGEHAYADNVFDIDTRFAVDEYIIAGVMKDGTVKYQSDYDNDHWKENALDDLAGAVSLVSHTTEGINGLDASGKLLTHDINLMNQIEIYDSMHIENYSGIKQVVHGIQNDYYVVMLLNDGRVVCAAEEGQDMFPDIKNWKNIRDIQDRHDYILGIDTNGKVHIAYAVNKASEHSLDVSQWPAVKTVYSKGNYCLIGLTTENTIVMTHEGSLPVPEFLPTLTGVVDIHFLSDSGIASDESGKSISLVAVLFEDGKVRLYDYNGKPVEYEPIDQWREVVRLEDGLEGMIGITHKGTIESYESGIEGYAGWSDIVAVQTFFGYYDFTVGVKADGTVVTTSDGTYSTTEEVLGGDGDTHYVDREQTGGTYCDVASWDLW